MVPFGIGMAATVRVGHAVGRNDAAAVKRAGLVAMLLGLALGAILTLAVILARFAIARFFLGEDIADEGMADADATVALAAELLLVGATFYITDGLQSIAVGALRGIKDTRIPLLFAAIGYWAIGFSLSYLLGLHTALGAIGVWAGLSIGTTVYAALLVLRFRLLASRLASA
jgi:multidrug resistance protein, MATE family